MSRLSEAPGRAVVYNNLGQTMRRPGQWQKQMAQIDETAAKGIRAYPMCTPNRITDYFTMRNTQTFRGLPVWHPISLSSPEEQLKAYADPDGRKKLHDAGIEFRGGRRSAFAAPGGTTWWSRPGCSRKISGWRARPSARSPRRRARASSIACA